MLKDLDPLFHRIKEALISKGYTFERTDFERPWGGFFVMNENHTDQFIKDFFDASVDFEIKPDLKLSPKILIVAPKKRLSWQYHHRRSELWRVVEGQVGVVKSDTDEEKDLQKHAVGERIKLAKGERHRLVGLDDFGVVAEIWIHEDASNPSDESDIVRLQDDFGR